jgi:copper(I)-binding protein
MQRCLLALIFAAMLLTACSAASNEAVETGLEVYEVTVTKAKRGENSELFMTIHNHEREIHHLTGVTFRAAEGTELHHGEEVVQAIPVDAYTKLQLTPEGYHVVLTGLKWGLQKGDEIEIVLRFRDHKKIKVIATVGEATE